MGLALAGGSVAVAAQVFTSSFLDGENYVQFIQHNLNSAGWNRAVLMAGISFTMAASILNSYLDLDGERYEIVDDDHPPVHGGNPVQNGGTVKATLQNLGGIVQAISLWTYVVGGPDGAGAFITFTLPDSGDIADDGNNRFCDVVPSGSVGLYDYSPDGVGTGRTWGGGYRVTSQIYSGTPLVLRIQTLNNNNLVTVKTDDELALFNGLVVTNDPLETWRIIANKYQFALFVPGNLSDGHFLFASHLYPATSFANYITGPTIAAPSHGKRLGLDSIAGNYYVSTPLSTYVSRNGLGTANQTPCLVIPGYGIGQTPIDKLGNPFNFDILRLDGNAIPFDAFIAVCRNNPASSSSETVRIIGWLWDALVYSAYKVADTTGFIDSNHAVCLFSQQGTTDNSCGSLMLLTEH